MLTPLRSATLPTLGKDGLACVAAGFVACSTINDLLILSGTFCFSLYILAIDTLRPVVSYRVNPKNLFSKRNSELS